MQHFHRFTLYIKLPYSVLLGFLLPACILLIFFGQTVYAFSEQNPCFPDFNNALDQLQQGENPALLLKIKQSASRGSGVGLCCLAELYFEGWGVKGNEEKAWELFQQAAQKGNAVAMHRIGTMYELGTYVDKDYTWAMLWYLRSAVRGYADAQTAAGILYEDGLAGYRDITAALYWYEKAADQSDPFAVEAVQRLEKINHIHTRCDNQRVATSNSLHIVVPNQGIPCPGLKISCPAGAICDESYAYRAYEYTDQDLYLYISFDPEIVGDYSLKSLRNNFKYMNFRIYFPDRQTEKSKFYYHNVTPIRKIGKASSEGSKFTIDSYEDGIVRGTIKGTITKITEKIESYAQDCLSDDIMGICFKSEDANIHFAIKFSLVLEY